MKTTGNLTVSHFVLCLMVPFPGGQRDGVQLLTFSGTGPRDQPAGQWRQAFSPSRWHLGACEQTATRCGRRRSPGGRCGGQRQSLSTCGGLGGPWTTQRCHSAERMHTPGEEKASLHLLDSFPALPCLSTLLPLSFTSLSSSTHNLWMANSVPGVGLGGFHGNNSKSSVGIRACVWDVRTVGGWGLSYWVN